MGKPGYVIVSIFFTRRKRFGPLIESELESKYISHPIWSKTGKTGIRCDGMTFLMRISLDVTAAALIRVEASILSDMTVCSQP